MNLIQVRTKFRQLSGRFDLVNDDYSDNGADFFIYEGQKFLDRMNETQKSWASIFRYVNIGYFSASFPLCRAIKEVWAASTTARWQLEKLSLQDLKDGYLAGLPSSRENGLPEYFSPGITRFVPENASAVDLEAYAGFVDIPAGATEYNSIILNVPVEEKLSLEIVGLLYTMELVNDADENYWSAVHPLLLVSAAMMMTEVPNRNTQGFNDMLNLVTKYNTQLGMDLVEELIAEVNQMEG